MEDEIRLKPGKELFPNEAGGVPTGSEDEVGLIAERLPCHPANKLCNCTRVSVMQAACDRFFWGTSEGFD